MFDFTQWNKLDADKGGELEERVLEIRSDPCALTRYEAIVVVCAEIGKNPIQTAIMLGTGEHTINNYRTIVRKKTNTTGENVPFDLIFRHGCLRNATFPCKKL